MGHQPCMGRLGRMARMARTGMRRGPRGLWPLLVVAAVGCGTNEGVFIPEYAQLYCAKQIECSGAATQLFNGVDGTDDCVAAFGPEVEATSDGCKYKGGKAKQCLTAIETLTCPANADPFDTVVPPICDEVYVKCISSPDGSNDTGS